MRATSQTSTPIPAITALLPCPPARSTLPGVPRFAAPASLAAGRPSRAPPHVSCSRSPRPKTQSWVGVLARIAGVTGVRVAGWRLQLGVRLAALGQQVALVDAVVDEVPRQHLV